MTVEKIWVERGLDLACAEKLSSELNISWLLAKMLVARNVTEPMLATAFLSPSLKDLTEPLLFKDMDKAVVRITQAIIAKEKIGIFGDYDVDGVCSTAVLQQFLVSVGGDVVVTLPNRMAEGYGLSCAGVDRLKEQGASLLLTADCGILAHEEVAYANDIGFAVIVVDHHNVGATLPHAHAVVNPKRPDCEANADFLCAAGVAFFLCAALRRYLREQGHFLVRKEPDLRDLLDLVALATVCDVVPLIKDNRSIVKNGLRVIKQGSRFGLNALIEACSIDKEKISSTNLGFHLGPRINAAGRLEDATCALHLLNSQDEDEAKRIATGLSQTNQERRSIEEETVLHVCQIIDGDDRFKSMKALVLHHDSWHPGVVGIVASRIAERYHRPAIIIGAKGKGSGRSIKGVDLHEMVSKASKSLAGFGGHAHAIGVTLGDLSVDAFRNDLLAVMKDLVPDGVFNKEIFYDAEISLNAINLSVIDELLQLEPFGAKNPYPVVRINRCFMRNVRRLNGGHLKGELENHEGYIAFIGFRMDIDDDLANSALDVLGVLEKNEWLNKTSAQFRLIDYKKSAAVTD